MKALLHSKHVTGMERKGNKTVTRPFFARMGSVTVLKERSVTSGKVMPAEIRPVRGIGELKKKTKARGEKRHNRWKKESQEKRTRYRGERRKERCTVSGNKLAKIMERRGIRCISMSQDGKETNARPTAKKAEAVLWGNGMLKPSKSRSK